MAPNNYEGDGGDVDKNDIFETKISLDGKEVDVLLKVTVVNGEEMEETLTNSRGKLLKWNDN